MHKNIDKYWNTYKSIYGFENVLKKYRHQVALEFLKELQPLKILEIGCGFNPMFTDYQSFESYTVVEPGEEPFDRMREQIRNDSRIHGFHNFAENEIKELSKNEYDCILLPGVLHEVENPFNFLGSIGNLCNTGTSIYINVPNANSLHRLIAVEMGLIESVFTHTDRNLILEQKTIFNRESLVELVKSSIMGIRLVEFSTFFIKPFTHNQMELFLKSKIIPEEIVEALFSISNLLPNFGSEIKSVFKISN